MTTLDMIALMVAVLCLVDAVPYLLAMPKKRFRKWTDLMAKLLRSRSRWVLTFVMIVVIVAFAGVLLQQMTIVQIVPGLFLGVLASKMVLVSQYPKELIPMAKRLSDRIDWYTVVMDLVVAGAVFWALFVR